VTKNDCVVFSDCIDVVVVGLASPDAESPMVYPNPSEKTLRIRIPKTWVSTKISVIDWSGKIRSNFAGKGGETVEQDVSDYASGVYLIKCESEGRSEIIKFIKY
jgi:hypothetical protein